MMKDLLLFHRKSPNSVAMFFKNIAVGILAAMVGFLLSMTFREIIFQMIGSFFYIAIALSTWIGNTEAGITTVVLSALLLKTYFIPDAGLLYSPVLCQECSVVINQYLKLLVFLTVALTLYFLILNLKSRESRILSLSQQLNQAGADRLKLVLHAANMGMWDWNHVTGEINWSVEHEDLLGLPRGSFDGRYVTFDQCLYPDDRLGLEKAVQGAIHSHSPYCHEFRVVWPDGSIHWLEGRGHAFYDSQGKCVRMIGTVMDIDQRKKSELQIQEKQETLRLLICYAPASIAIFDQNMTYLMVSQRWLQDYYLPMDFQYEGRCHYDVFPEIPDYWKEVHQRSLGGEIVTCDEDLFVRADGSKQWLKWGVYPWYNLQGSVAGIVIFSEDITQRKQAELALLELNSQLEKRVQERIAELAQVNSQLMESLAHSEDLYNNAPCGYHSLDSTGRIVRMNNTELAWIGRSREEVEGKIRYQDLLTEEGKAIFRENFPRFMRVGFISNLEFELFHRDGSSRWINLTSTAIKNAAGEFLMSRSTMFDISDLKKADHRWRSLLDHVQLVVLGFSEQGKVNYANPFFLKLTGYTIEEIIDQSWHTVCVSSDSPYASPECFTQLLASHTHLHYQDRIITKDGEERWIAWNNTKLQSFDQQVIGMITIGEDITERHKLEDIKNSFIAVVSHELRTPLTAIQMSLGLLKTGIYNNRPDRFQQMLNIAVLDTDRLISLVNDILALERLDSGRLSLDKVPCQAQDLLNQAQFAMEALAAKNGLTIVVKPSTATVLADSTLILQALTNLLGNAIKFSPSGSEIILGVELLSNPLENWVIFSVADHGRGIPEDKLEMIFGRFQQVDASDSREKGGTGLGLSICRSIIDRHGGKIWVESKLGQGSTFFFTLMAVYP